MAIYLTKRTDRLFRALIFGCMMLIVWEIFIYEKTFISLFVPLAVWLLTGILITILSRGRFVYQPAPSTWMQLLFNIIVWGGMTMFAFMWTNEHLCAKTTRVVNEKILSTGHLTSKRAECAQPYIEVVYKGQEKQLMFDCDTPVENFTSVDLTIARGLFGFDILLHATLKAN
jgi:hypothetical protein